MSHAENSWQGFYFWLVTPAVQLNINYVKWLIIRLPLTLMKDLGSITVFSFLFFKNQLATMLVLL